MIFFYIVSLACLLGVYKGINAYFACIKADAIEAAANMFLMAFLFFIILGITLYVGSHYEFYKINTLL